MTLIAEPVQAALPTRRLGKTGERLPVLGLGTGPGGFGLDDREAIRLYHAAIDRGVTTLDTAPGYGRAQKQLGEVIRRRRGEVFLVTKTWTASGAEALSILEQSLRDLRTEQVDLVYSHCIGSFDPDEILSPEGTLAGLREAQRRGWARFVGFTAHHAPWKAVRILREAEVDVVMLAMNFADRFTYNFEGEVLPLAVERDVGAVAMKVYGGARDMNYEVARESAMDGGDHRLALRYALHLPGVACAVVGMYNERELDQNLRWARDLTPLSPSEEAHLESEGRRLAERWGPHFGALE